MKKRKILKIIADVLLYTVTAVMLFFLVFVIIQKAMGEAPGLFGYRLMYVMTGSMEPEISAGSAVIVKDEKGENLSVGDVVCYNGTQGDFAGKRIIHRVIVAPYERDGKTYLVTRGDANNSADPEICADQVIGVVVYETFVLGTVLNFFHTRVGFLVMLSPMIIFLVTEVVHIAKLCRSENDDGSDGDDEDSEQSDETD